MEKIFIINKIDKNKNTEKIKQQLNLNNKNSVLISMLKGQNMDLLNNILEQKIKSLSGLTESPSITRARHREILTKTKECLVNSQNSPMWEMMAEDIRLSCNYLGQITGKIDVEDILDSLFSSFCIGK